MKLNNCKFNRAAFRDKVFGCWYGKSIGGTLGTPYEQQRTMNNVTFYPPEINGVGLPNDDLDLQLLWLAAVEKHGMLNLNERILGEYWHEFMTAPWNEYGVCRSNLQIGLTPPLTGSCGNERWKWSNGAWIRSEIWACIYPGSPEKAARAAYWDSCCDHCGEGVYAEIFIASLESAAFIEKRILPLIELALTYIPADCRIARAVRLAVKCYTDKLPLPEAREKIVQDSADIGWFQAPANVAFMVLGLLYGEGDFEKAVVLAVNCGDDTDCTGGTAGAVMGIILGEKAIPEKWKKPIGKTIKTCSIDNTLRSANLMIPETLDELTDRVMLCAENASHADPFVFGFTNGDAVLPEKIEQEPDYPDFLAEISPYRMTFDLPWGKAAFEFENGPYVEPGIPLKIKFSVALEYAEIDTFHVSFTVPEDWTANDIRLSVQEHNSMMLQIVPGLSTDAVMLVPVEIRRQTRRTPYIVHLPLIRKESVEITSDLLRKIIDPNYRHWPERNRCVGLLERFREEMK